MRAGKACASSTRASSRPHRVRRLHSTPAPSFTSPATRPMCAISSPTSISSSSIARPAGSPAGPDRSTAARSTATRRSVRAFRRCCAWARPNRGPTRSKPSPASARSTPARSPTISRRSTAGSPSRTRAKSADGSQRLAAISYCADLRYDRHPRGPGRSIRFRRRQLVVYRCERGHEMALDLPADQDEPLLGTVAAEFGLREVGLEAADLTLDFDPRVTKALVRFGPGARDARVRLDLDPFDSRLGLGLRAVDGLLGLRQL